MGFMVRGWQVSSLRMAAALAVALLSLAPSARAADYDPLDQAFVAAQWAMLSSAGRALQQTGLRAAAGDPELARKVRDRQDLADRALDLEDRLADETQPEARIALRGEIDSLEDEMASIDLVLARDFPRFADFSAPAPMSIAQVQAMLRGDEALLLFLSGRDVIFIFAVGPQQVAFHRAPYGTETLAGDIAKLRRQLDPLAVSRGAVSLVPGKDRPRVASFDRGLAHLLYLELLAPLDGVLAKASHLHVVADGPISGLPLSLLVTEKPLGDDTDPQALRDTQWLVRRHATTTLPDVGSLSVIRGLPTVTRGERQLAFAGFGAPVLGGQTVEAALGNPAVGQAFFRGAFADVSAVRNLPALPQTGPEIERLASSLGGRSSLHLGAEATEAVVKSTDLSGYDIIAFATHGLLSGDLEGLEEPALVLTPPEVASSRDDGLLTASEIAALKLTAEWVILSACNTAGGNGEPDAEGLSGLARAFLYAGARSILVSHWPVRDDAAAMLTTGAIARLSTGAAEGRSEALRQAMLEVMNSPKDHSLAHPSAWAPFAIVGEGK